MTKGDWRSMELVGGKRYEDSLERGLQVSGGRILREFRRAVLSLFDGRFCAILRLHDTARSSRRPRHCPLHPVPDLLLSRFHPKGASAAHIADCNRVKLSYPRLDPL